MKLNYIYEDVTANCVAVVVRHNGKFLLGKCASGSRKGYWCFPGGHIERGETDINAAVREVAEETGLHVHIMKKPIGKINSRCIVYMADSSSDGPVIPNHEFTELKWFSKNELLNIKILNSNMKFLMAASGEH